MSQLRTIQEINEKIAKGQVVVATAEEVISLVEKQGVEKTARQVDVVTTGAFGPMCSSGAFLNLGHTTPRMRMSKVSLNGVSAYAGIAAWMFISVLRKYLKQIRQIQISPVLLTTGSPCD